jgi:hypothetical protein
MRRALIVLALVACAVEEDPVPELVGDWEAVGHGVSVDCRGDDEFAWSLQVRIAASRAWCLVLDLDIDQPSLAECDAVGERASARRDLYRGQLDAPLPDPWDDTWRTTVSVVEPAARTETVELTLLGPPEDRTLALRMTSPVCQSPDFDVSAAQSWPEWGNDVSLLRRRGADAE